MATKVKAVKKKDEKPSFLADVGRGMMGAYAGVKQLYLQGKDKITGRKEYDAYTRKIKDDFEAYDTARAKSGKGANVGAFLGNAVAIPVPVAKVGQGVKMLTGLGKNAAIGAGLGAVQFAEDAKQRAKNATFGAVGGAVGAGLGKVAEKGTKKVVNAVKGRKKGNANEIEKLAKQHGVRVSAGDLGRKPITQKTEVALEQVPAVGMAGYREAQHREVKNASERLAQKFANQLNQTEFKYIQQVEKMAQRGNGEAQRLLQAIRSANTPDEILQTSLKLQAFRDRKIGSQLFGQVEKLLAKHPHQNVNPYHTLNLVNQELATQRNALMPNEAIINELAKLQKRLQNPNVAKTFSSMKQVRSHLGELAEKYMAQGDRGTASFFTNLRSNVTKDMDVYIASVGDRNIKIAYQRANKHWSNLDRNKARIQAQTTEEADKIYSKFVQTGGGDKAKHFYNNLDAKGQAALRYRMMEEAMNKATNESTGHFSPAKFAGEFERMSKPYQHIFHGADRAEMDGFVKLMRHVERAGQYMENPATGNRLGNMAVGGTLATNVGVAMKGGAIAGLAKVLFTSKAGKNLLLAASDTTNSRAMDNVLSHVGKLATKSGIHLSIGENYAQYDDEFFDDQSDEQVNSEGYDQGYEQNYDVANPFQDNTMNDTGYTDDIGYNESDQNLQNAMPENFEMPDAWQAPQTASYQPQEMSMPDATQHDQAMSQPVTHGHIANPFRQVHLPPDQGMAQSDAEYLTDIPMDYTMPSNDMQSMTGQALFDMVQPPKEQGNAKKQDTYQAFANQSVQRVMQSEPMQRLQRELNEEYPDFDKVDILQKTIENSPEWKSYLKSLPEEQRQKVANADIINLITNSSIHGNSGFFNPTF